MFPFFLALYNHSQVSIVALWATCLVSLYIQVSGVTHGPLINSFMAGHKICIGDRLLLYLSLVVRNWSSVFLTRSDTNWAVQSQKMARGLKFRIKVGEGLYCPCSENKGADQLRPSGLPRRTAKLICVFVFAYAKSRFSHYAAHFKVCF